MASSLPARYRPRSFGDVVGQGPAKSALLGMISSGRVPPQVIFSGPSGCGKTTLARIVAASLLCSGGSAGGPCASCPSCRLVAEGSHPDLVEVDAASYGGKDSILELSGRSSLMPLVGSVRVFIVDEAHGITAAGAQAFLKTLEEPSPGVHFFFCTTEPERLIPTIRSRCVEIRLAVPYRSERAELAVRVAASEGWLLEGETALALVDATDPRTGVRGVLNSLARVAPATAGRISPSDVALILGSGPQSSLRVVAAIEGGDPSSALGELDVSRMSASDETLRSGLASWCRERLLGEFGGPAFEVWRRLLAELAQAEGLGLDAWVVGAAHASLAGRGRASVSTAGAVSVPDDIPDAGSNAAVGRILGAAAPYPDALPGLLGRCVVRETKDAIEIEVPSRIMAALEPQVPVLRTAAGRLGLPLKVSAV